MKEIKEQPETINDKIDTLVRDATSVEHYTKSEIRRRIYEILDMVTTEAIKELKD